jgi:hypothetical protein
MLQQERLSRFSWKERKEAMGDVSKEVFIVKRTMNNKYTSNERQIRNENGNDEKLRDSNIKETAKMKLKWK